MRVLYLYICKCLWHDNLYINDVIAISISTISIHVWYPKSSSAVGKIILNIEGVSLMETHWRYGSLFLRRWYILYHRSSNQADGKCKCSAKVNLLLIYIHLFLQYNVTFLSSLINWNNSRKDHLTNPICLNSFTTSKEDKTVWKEHSKD